MPVSLTNKELLVFHRQLQVYWSSRQRSLLLDCVKASAVYNREPRNDRNSKPYDAIPSKLMDRQKQTTDTADRDSETMDFVHSAIKCQ